MNVTHALTTLREERARLAYSLSVARPESVAELKKLIGELDAGIRVLEGKINV